MTMADVVGLPAQVAAELDRLAGPAGTLYAPDVVVAARPRTSPLHDQFTWDNREAADVHRLGQAADLIRRYKIRVLTQTASGEERQVLARGYTSARRAGVEGTAPGTYLRTEALDGPQREAVLRTMAREIAALRTRYQHLPEFWMAISDLPAAASGG